MPTLPLLQWLPSLFLLSLLSKHSLAITNPPLSRIKAVNLGGWLVTEGWMTSGLFDKIPNNDLLDGTQVQLKSVRHQKYLTAENGGGAAIVATRTSASGWESFVLWRKGSSFQFKVFNNQFIGLGNQGQGGVVAAATSPGEPETFQIVRNSGNAYRVRLKAPNGLFVRAKQDGSVTADGQESTSWEDNDSSVFDLAVVPGTNRQGEFQLTNGYGKDMATSVLMEHWSSYIVEDDFNFMSQNGINAVRIPVGYWIANDNNPPAPYVGGSLAFLDRAFTWAENNDIKVIVDLHAAPGSQNGNDHSGSRDGSQEWGKTQQNINQTVMVIDFLASRYARRPGLLAMELINEPLAPGVSLDSLKYFYKAGYDTVREYSPDCYVILSNRLGPADPKELLQFAAGLDGTVIDVHYYNLYSDFFTKKSVQENIDYVHNDRAAQIGEVSQSNGPLVFVGEWTAHLEGASDQDAQRFAAAELDVFGRASFGWAYWSYRNTNPQWSLKYMIKNGFISLK